MPSFKGPFNIVIAAIICWPIPGRSQTSDFLNAPRVQEQLQVRLEGKTITYSLGASDNFNTLDPDKLFVASTPIKLTYDKLNPLKLQASASVSETDDPGNAAVSKLIDALASFPTSLKPGATGANARALVLTQGACPGETAALDAIAALDSSLYGDVTSRDHITNQLGMWVNDIDKAFGDAHATGPTAIAAGAADVGKYKTSLDAQIKAASKTVSIIQAGAAATDPDSALPDAVQQCAKNTKRVYQALELTNPERRVEELTELSSTLADLTKKLTDSYGQDSQWIDKTYFIIGSFSPKADKVQKVTIKVVTSRLQLSGIDLSIAASNQQSVSSSFTLREFSRFAPEVGAGAVFSFIDVPQYGTTTNSAGKMVVGSLKSTSVSIAPTLMINFVCRCGAGPYIEPMFQIGVAASTTAPAILAGGGLRLFSLPKGNAALGGGLALAWTKDLTKLHLGDVVSGTADIQADLSFNHAPKAVPYVTIQYNF